MFYLVIKKEGSEKAVQNSFKKGITDGFPICIGYLSVSFAFGIFAAQNGLSVIEAVLISMTNLTSAGQLAGVPIICGGGSLLELAVSQLVINSRYSLMSVSLSQKLGSNIKMLDRFLISFGNTDEIFAVAISNKESLGKKYMSGLIFTPYIGWAGGTLLGAVAGFVLPEIVITSLGVAIYGMFIAIVTPVLKENRAVAAVVVISIILSCLFKFLPILSAFPSGFVVIICAVIASAAMAIFAPVESEGEENA